MSVMINEKRLVELNELLKHIGNTPVYRFKAENRIEIYAILEWMQFGQNVKSRPALSMIEVTLQNGKILSVYFKTSRYKRNTIRSYFTL